MKDAPKFRVKGNLYRGTIDYFEQQVPGGLKTLLKSIEDPMLRAFIQQNFFTTGWYDALPVADLIHCEAAALGMSESDYLQQRTTYQAEHDLRGVYAFVLRIARPRRVATLLPKVSMQMFDFATPAITLVENERVECEVRGIPKKLGPWLSTSIPIYAEFALKLAGARSASVRGSLREEPSADDEERVTMDVMVRWK